MIAFVMHPCEGRDPLCFNVRCDPLVYYLAALMAPWEGQV